jgi:hypothetical protein
VTKSILRYNSKSWLTNATSVLFTSKIFL